MKLVVAVLLLAVTAQAADGEPDAGDPPLFIDVERAQLTQPDGGHLLVGSGCYLDEGSCVGVGRALRGKDARIVVDEAAPDVRTLTIVAGISLAVGIIAGGYLVYRLDRL